MEFRAWLIFAFLTPGLLFSSPLQKIGIGANAGTIGEDLVLSLNIEGEFHPGIVLAYHLLPQSQESFSKMSLVTSCNISPLLSFSANKDFRVTYGTVGGKYYYYIYPRLKFQLSLSYALPLHSDLEGQPTGFVGFNYTLKRFDDADGDGVVDKLDECPETPENAKVDGKGCGLDTDGDGVFDGLDKCPDSPFAAFVDSLGCPYDSDGDLVYDGVDICPGTPSDLKVDSVGCPLDEDKDGVPDYQDSCKTTPIGAKVDKKGCAIDSDYDGVPDGIDECPYTATGFQVNAQGCPKYLPIEHEVIYDPMDEFGKLKSSVKKKLDFIALRIKAYPIRIIEIGGYTDNEGSAPYNKGRARRMVQAMNEYLLSKGVSPKNLKLVYYGEVSFVASNATPQGRAKNRRVEFKYVGTREDIGE